jgi:hypothetical protein
MATIRRELLYFLLCGAVGLAAYPAIVTIVGNILIRRGEWSPWVWNPYVIDAYPIFFSSLFRAILHGHLYAPFVAVSLSFLVPYALFQIFRWSFRGIRLACHI